MKTRLSETAAKLLSLTEASFSSWTPKGLFYTRPGQIAKLSTYSGDLPPVRRDVPEENAEVAAWISKGGYIGWSPISTAKSWARRKGGGSTRAGGAWVPGDGDGDHENIGLVAELVRVNASQLAGDDEAYKNNIRRLATKPDNFSDFTSGILYGDPDGKYGKLKYEYEKALRSEAVRLTAEFLERL